MEKVPEQFEPGNPGEAKPDHYVQFIAPMTEILADLSKHHREAYELFGGDDMYWHLEETPLDGTATEAKALASGLQTLREFSEVAADDHATDRQMRLDQKIAQFQKTLYGITTRA